MNQFEQPDEKMGDEFGFLMDMSARRILRDEDPDSFINWFTQYAPGLAPSFAANLPQENDFRHRTLSLMARIIWNRTPLPGNHYRPKPLPRPERNHPCPCGSGKKYKHCCHELEGLEQNMATFSMLLHVLDTVPVSQFASLPYTHINLEELEYVAHTWLSNGHAKEAAKLLEGVFNDWSKLDERAEPALYCLLDCYDRLNNPLKKKRLLQRGMAAPNKFLRSGAIQRQCTILTDRGDYEEAWRLFQEAQRLTPNDASLSHLEVLMLQSQGEHARAKQRAAFWIARLSKDPSGQYADLIEFLRNAADDFGGAHLDMLQHHHQNMAEFTKLVAQLPKPVCHYQLHPDGQQAGGLDPDAAMRKLLTEWSHHIDGFHHSPAIYWDEDLPWLTWLKTHPLAWQSFEVLLTLSHALADTEPRLPRLEEKFVLPLLEQAESLLRLAIKKHHAEGQKLEWGWHENRPALSLIANLAFYYKDHDNLPRSVELLEWCVLTLNPNDNQGLREYLLHSYLRMGKVREANKLAALYPDDMPAMRYGSILARYLNGQHDDALSLLKQTHADYPQIPNMLLSAKPRRPKLNPGYRTLGGKDEAWYYREENLDIWQQSGALQWMAQRLGKKSP